MTKQQANWWTRRHSECIVCAEGSRWASAAWLIVVSSSRHCWLFPAAPSSESDASFHDVSQQQHRAGMRLQVCLLHTGAHLSLSFSLTTQTLGDVKPSPETRKPAPQCKQNSSTAVTRTCFHTKKKKHSRFMQAGNAINMFWHVSDKVDRDLRRLHFWAEVCFAVSTVNVRLCSLTWGTFLNEAVNWIYYRFGGEQS